MGNSETKILYYTLSIIGALSFTALCAWIFAYVFQSKELLHEARKQTALVKKIATKHGVSNDEIEGIENSNR